MARDVKHIHDEQTNRYTCGYCNKSIRRKGNFISHLKGCTVRIIFENFQSNHLNNKKLHKIIIDLN